jgi:hypothetical protein
MKAKKIETRKGFIMKKVPIPAKITRKSKK